MKNTIFFDLGNVIVYFSHEKMAQQIAFLLDTSPEIIYQFVKSQNLIENYELGIISSHDIHLKFNNHFHKKMSFTDMMDAVCDIFNPNQLILPILENLKKNRVFLIILSNTCRAHFEYLYKRYPFLQLFDEFILSYEVNLRKPDEKIFELALSKIRGKNAFYIDDIPEYVAVAQKVGLDAEVFKNVSTLKVHLEERNFL